MCDAVHTLRVDEQTVRGGGPRSLYRGCYAVVKRESDRLLSLSAQP
jgi:hypothetical protein